MKLMSGKKDAKGQDFESWNFPLSQKRKSPELLQHTKTPGLGGGFKYVLFSTLLGEMIKFD